MNQLNQTLKRIEAILTSKYDATNFTDLIREIFPSVKIVAPDIFRKEYTNFSSHIEGSFHIGNYSDPDGKKLIIHAVQLKKESYVENSRSTQRSYAKKLMEAGNVDAAIIAFFTDGDPKWRMSFVRLDYEIKFENGKLNTSENLTPAKRYSYLVGQDEPCHTAISRFRRFITDDPNVAQPTLDDLEEAFSVEKVTEEFFNLYCEKFHQLRESLEANPDFVIEAEQHNFTSAQFAKKLMGQIVFLYFLQKKGWLGVSAWPKEMNAKEYKKAFFARGTKSRELIPRVYIQVSEDLYKLSGRALNELSDDDETVLASCVKGNAWGTGSKTFMRTLFEFSQRRKANFFDDFLEPLFYDALNVNRGEQGYDPALHCRIPFLSGGLFEPIDGYDWKHNDFAIPNEVFSNRALKGERDADGILDIFDRYNFTMSEDEPLEREVAIDPEMLGKVFENLLEVQDRKSKGAFYTPREIVHYMCQETLISYLIKETGLKEQDVRDFILLGDFLKDEDTAKNRRQGEHDMLISEEIFKIDRNGRVVVDRLKDIDNALANIRVADPAVGSGAFPLGMLNEIVRARQNISAYMAITMDAYHTRMMYNNERSPYALKLQTIKNCIFAADIEPSAVDIAQLRLWLSLVIDDVINPDANSPLDGHKNPIPLPNLECNILCGNSLVDSLMGVPLIDKASNVVVNSSEQINIYTQATNAILPSLFKAQEELFHCVDTNQKPIIKQRIESLRDEIIKVQLQNAADDVIEAYEESKLKASKPFILWELDFARVFQEKGGFDIVIGNPPYVGERKHKDVFYEVQKSSLAKYYFGRMDFFYFFFHLGLDILKNDGICALITTNYFTTALGGRVLRNDFKDRADVVEMINFNECKVFQTALGQHNMITILRKGHSATMAKTAVVNVSRAINTKELASILRKEWGVSMYEVSQENLYDGEENYIRLTGLANNENPINSILSKMVEAATDVLGNVCKPLIGLESSLDSVYVLTKEQVEEIIQGNEAERVYVKAFFKGSQIHRYYIEKTTDKYILYLHEKIDDIESLPGIWRYLRENEEAIKGRKGANLRGAYKRGNWWVLNTPRLDMDFNDEKIVTHYRSKSLRFAYSDTPWYASRDVYYIIKNKQEISLKYILALLNSAPYYLWFYNRGKRKGDTLELYAKPLKEVPIIEIPEEEQRKFVELVDLIIACKEEKKDTKELESSIDALVYELFGFTDEEIAIIESKGDNKYGIV